MKNVPERTDLQSSEVRVPETTDKPSDTGAGKPTDEAATRHVSESVGTGGTSGPGHGEPVPKETNIPEPTPKHPHNIDEGNGPAPLGS